MNEAIGISILTNGARLKELQRCLESFIAGTDCAGLSFAIFDNGSTDDTWEWLQHFDFPHGVVSKFERSLSDLGCAAGTNAVAAMVRNFKYVLHLECDFLLLPEKVTGEDKDWLKRAVSHLEATGSDYLYLRRMASPDEARNHWWSQWMPKVIQGTGAYMPVPDFWWSNNPHLRLNEAIYVAGCLPLDESKDGPKGTPGWSKPELEAKRPQKASIHRWGMFVHETLPEGATGPQEACNGSPGSVPWCKYGFFLDGTHNWCGACDPQKNLEDLPDHERRFATAMIPPFTVLTVDNGWSYTEFERITSKIPNCQRILVAKGAGGIPSTEGLTVVPPDRLDEVIKQVDAALFCKVGDANRPEYEKILKVGVPMVVHVDHHQGLIDHQKNGFYYQDEAWAVHWLLQLRGSEALRAETKKTWKEMGGRRDSMLTAADVAKFCPSCADKMRKKKITAVKREVVEQTMDKEQPPKVTVITPTFKRDPKILRRAVDCMLLQTETKWEQLVCSNGPEEIEARSTVEGVRDARVRYRSLGVPTKEGDFGNSARAAMLKEARGEFVMFLDDDNIILPNYLDLMYQTLLNAPDCGFVVCQVMHFGPLNEEALGKAPKVLEGEPVKLHHIDPLQVMVRRAVMQEIGWDVEKGYLSDGVTLEKLGQVAKHLKVSQILGIHT